MVEALCSPAGTLLGMLGNAEGTEFEMETASIRPGYGRPYWGRFWGWLVTMLLAFFLLIGLPTAFLGMPVPVLVIGPCVLFPLLMGWILRSAMRWVWNPMLAPYPPVAPAENAVSRSYQSFSLGAVNLAFSVHVVVDDAYLHLSPAGYLRMFGACGASISWDACGPSKPSVLGTAIVSLNGTEISAPRWCLQSFGSDVPQG